MITKAKLKSQLDKLPDNFTIDELIDHLVLIDKIEKGQEQSKKGKIITDKDLDNKITEWAK